MNIAKKVLKAILVLMLIICTICWIIIIIAYLSICISIYHMGVTNDTEIATISNILMAQDIDIVRISSNAGRDTVYTIYCMEFSMDMIKDNYS